MANRTKGAHRKLLLIVSLALSVSTVLLLSAVYRWNALSWLLIGLLQLTLVLLHMNTRHVLSRRIFASANKLHRQLSVANGRSESKPQRALHLGHEVDSGRKGEATGAGPTQKRGEATDIDRHISLVLAARIFDQEWYERQVEAHFASIGEACRHYLVRGRRTGFSPHPLFVPSFVSPQAWKTDRVDPLVRYVEAGDHERAVKTHPLFDPALVDSFSRPTLYGPLADFLLHASPATPLPYDANLLGLRPGISVGEVTYLMYEECAAWRRREMDTLPLRGSAKEPQPPFELVEAIRRFEGDDHLHPLVSIVLPTWNRAGKLRTSIESVQRQTYPHWELIVADDGSTDDTLLAVTAEANRDPRICVLSLPHRGVSAARNAALTAARGDYVAFLDSDKEWDHDFLRTMLAVMIDEGLEAAASACEVQMGSQTFYRSVQPTAESLRIGNSVDQTAIVVSRSTLLRTGGFDESLRRAVDYDLILSLNELAQIRQIPYVGVRYSEDDQDANRISEAESISWNYFVRDRRLWADLQKREPKPLDAEVLTVIVDRVTSFGDAVRSVKNISQHSAGQKLEVLLLNWNNYWPSLQSLVAIRLSEADVHLVYADSSGVRPVLINSAIRQATGAHVLILDAQQQFIEGDLRSMVDGFREGHAAAYHPIVLNRQRLVHNAGVIYANGGIDPVPFLSDFPLDGLDLPRGLLVPGAPLPLLANTMEVRSIQGMNAKLRRLWTDIDLSQRLALKTSRAVVASTDLHVQQLEESLFDRNAESASDVEMFYSLWRQSPEGSEDACRTVGLQATFIGSAASSEPKHPERWTRAVWRPVPIEVSAGRPRLRWAIKTAAPADERAESWGDFHFGQSLANALRRLGQLVSVDYHENGARATSHVDDVVVNLRGLRDAVLPPGSINVIWVISHPELVMAKELLKYDVRYAASNPWAQSASEQFGTDVRTLLQCTDPTRFFPSKGLVPEVADHILMVGNSRKQFRPAAWHVAHAGLPIRIYGSDWEEHVPTEAVAGRSVSNSTLSGYYGSARFTLNDHWPEMRELGFISNRIFDVVASAGRLVTDSVSGLDEVFSDEIAVFQSPHELLDIVSSEPRASFPTRERLLEASSRVREHHSFDQRAAQMLQDVLQVWAKGRPSRASVSHIDAAY